MTHRVTYEHLLNRTEIYPFLYVGSGEISIKEGSFQIELFFVELKYTKEELIKLKPTIFSWNYFNLKKGDEYTVIWGYKKLIAFSLFQIIFERKVFAPNVDWYQNYSFSPQIGNTSKLLENRDNKVINCLNRIHSGLTKTFYSITQNETDKSITTWVLPSSEIFVFYYARLKSKLIEFTFTGEPRPLYNEAYTIAGINKYAELDGFVQLRELVPDGCAHETYRHFHDKNYEKEFWNVHRGIYEEESYIRANFSNYLKINPQYIDISPPIEKEGAGKTIRIEEKKHSIRLVTRINSCEEAFKIPLNTEFDRDNNNAPAADDDGTKTTPRRRNNKPITSIKGGENNNPDGLIPGDKDLEEVDIYGSRESVVDNWGIPNIGKIKKTGLKTKSEGMVRKPVEAAGITDSGELDVETNQAPIQYIPAKEGRTKKAIFGESKGLNTLLSCIALQFKMVEFECLPPINLTSTNLNSHWAKNRKLFVAEVSIEAINILLIEIEVKPSEKNSNEASDNNESKKSNSFSLGLAHTIDLENFSPMKAFQLRRLIVSERGVWKNILTKYNKREYKITGMHTKHTTNLDKRVNDYILGLLKRKWKNYEDLIK